MKTSHTYRWWVSVLAFWAGAAWAARLPDEQNNIDIYQKCNPAVVNITAVTLRHEFFFEVVPQKGMGSGAIIRPEGYIVTNHHVVGNAVEVEVTLFDKTTFPAKVIGTDPDSDISILKINTKGRKLAALEFGSADSLAVGQKVLAIGNPFGLGGSLTVGVVSSLGRDIRATTDRLIKDVIQTDASINPGNSGGPLMDSSGKLIGINTQIVSTSGGSEGIGFAINVKTVKKIVDELIQFGRVFRANLGIEGVGLPAGVLAQFGVGVNHGVMITDIAEGSSASKAGLRPARQEVMWGFRPIPYGGDVIFQIDDIQVNTLRDINDHIVDKKSGDTVVIHYTRGQAKYTASIKLALPQDIRDKSL